MHRRLKRALASRGVAGLLIAVIGLASVAGASRVWVVYHQTSGTSSIFDDPRLQESLVALGDLDRISTMLLAASRSPEMEPATAARLQTALAPLDVRVRTFARMDQPDPRSAALAASAGQALAALAAHLDTAAAAGFPEPHRLAMDFDMLANAARQQMVQYLDHQSDIHTGALQQQRTTMTVLAFSLAALLATLAGIGSAAILLLRSELETRNEWERAVDRADYLAYNDALTGLPNRARFYEVLTPLLAVGNPVALVYFDLDDFKALNDTYGHNSGDTILRTVARRLYAATLRLGGMPARIGGDEFTVLLPGATRAQAEAFCADFLQRMEEPFAIDKATVRCRASLGVALSTALHDHEPPSCESLVGAADYALYDAKLAGRNTWRVYDETLAVRHAERRSLLEDIPRALAAAEFFAVYQPKVDLDTGAAYGFEALLRWRREGKMVLPASFVPLAEESGMIVDLDMWMLNEATRQVAAWNRDRTAPFSVSVNLSPLNFNNDNLVCTVDRALRLSGLPPELLTLEITETVLIRDWERVSGVLTRLKALGVRIALDDFGTGYSSLAYLRRIVVDELKIDRSFLADIETSRQTRFILDSIVDIAGSLGMALVVEGIERPSQAELVRAFGCRRVQGFAYGGPMTIEDLAAQGWTGAEARPLALPR